MNKKLLLDILDILYQIWWPIKISYQTKQIDLISEELIKFHIEKIEPLLVKEDFLLKDYWISDLFSLYMCLLHIINDLWTDEFQTVLWKDLYRDWYRVLLEVKSILLMI